MSKSETPQKCVNTKTGEKLLHRRYVIDLAKSLTCFTLPAQPENESDNIHLLGVTLNPTYETAVWDWMLQ